LNLAEHVIQINRTHLPPRYFKYYSCHKHLVQPKISRIEPQAAVQQPPAFGSDARRNPLRHYSIRTEAPTSIGRGGFILLHDKRHPKEIGGGRDDGHAESGLAGLVVFVP
jgi:hypothetical protein